MEATKKEAAIYNSTAAQHLHSVPKDNFVGPRGREEVREDQRCPIRRIGQWKRFQWWKSLLLWWGER